MPIFDLDKLEQLPSKQPFHQKWGHRRDNVFGKRNPYFTARKILENNIGKSYNLAFSYFCKNVNSKDQHIFKSYFTKPNRHDYIYENYIIDENGLIQYNNLYIERYNKKNKKNCRFKSKDVEYKTIHKDSGIDKKFFKPVKIIVGYKDEYEFYSKSLRKRFNNNKIVKKPIYKQIGWVYEGKSDFFILPDYKKIYAKDSDFITIVDKGIDLTFDSPNDPKLVKLRAETYKNYKKERKERKKAKNIDYDFILKQGSERLNKAKEDALLSKKELEAKLKLENDIKILAHGFDLETSFRTIISWKKKKEKVA